MNVPMYLKYCYMTRESWTIADDDTVNIASIVRMTLSTIENSKRVLSSIGI